MSTKIIDNIVLTIVIIGAVNWGLIGFFRFDLIAFYLGICPGSAESSMHWLESVEFT